jgi:hypothetical protein
LPFHKSQLKKGYDLSYNSRSKSIAVEIHFFKYSTLAAAIYILKFPDHLN